MSFVAAILEQCRRAEGEPVLYEVRGDELVPEPGRQFVRKVASARSLLRSHGVGRGDRVALLGPNSASWAAVDLGILAEGATSVPLHGSSHAARLQHMLRDSDPKLLIASDAASARAAMQLWPEHGPVIRFADVFDTTPVAYDATLRPPVGPVTIVYALSARNDDAPRPIVLTGSAVERALRATASQLARIVRPRRGQERVFHYLPFHSWQSRMLLWTQLYRGRPLILSTNLRQLRKERTAADPHYYLNTPLLLERIRSTVAQHFEARSGPMAALYRRATALYEGERNVAPTVGDKALFLLARTLLFPRIRRSIGLHLEFMLSEPSPVSEQTLRWFEMLDIPVYMLYGLSEAGGGTSPPLAAAEDDGGSGGRTVYDDTYEDVIA